MAKGKTGTGQIKIKVPYNYENKFAVYITAEDGTENDYTNQAFVKVKKRINTLWLAEITIIGIGKSDSIKEENTVKIFSKKDIVFKGIIKRKEYSNSYTTTLTCYGMASVLKKYETDQVYENTATETIFTALVDTATTSDEYALSMDSTNNGAYNDVTVRFDDENNLKGLNDLTEAIGHEWYESYGSFPYNTHEINIVSSMGSASSQYTFDTTNSFFNTIRKNTDEMCNYAVVLGYGDGVNQIKSECLRATDNFTTLASDINATATTITVDDASDLPSSGNVWVGCEKISYTGKSGNDLTGCSRGQAYMGNVETTENLTSGNGYAHEKGVAVFDAQYTTSSVESGSSIDSYGVVKRTYVEKSIVDQNTADRIARRIIENKKEPTETIYINVADPLTVMESVSLGDYITITDAQLDLSSADKRVVGMEFGYTPQKGQYLTLECSNKLPDFVTSLQKTQDETRKANQFMQGATNIYAISTYENADSSTHLNMRFYLPPDVIAVSSVKLYAKIQDYRAYAVSSQTATSESHTHTGLTTSDGGGTTQSSSSGGQHDHDLAYCEADWPEGADYPLASGVGTTLTTDVTHAHTTTIPDHSHDLDISSSGAHSHDITITYGIDTTAGGSDGTVDIYIGEDGSLPGSANYSNESGTISKDITSIIKDLVDGTGKWINIQFQASKKMRIEANAYIKIFIKSD